MGVPSFNALYNEYSKNQAGLFVMALEGGKWTSHSVSAVQAYNQEHNVQYPVIVSCNEICYGGGFNVPGIPNYVYVYPDRSYTVVGGSSALKSMAEAEGVSKGDVSNISNMNLGNKFKISINAKQISVNLNNKAIETIALFDMQGRKIKEVLNSNTLSLKGLSKGAFLVKIKSSDTVVKQKILIK